MADFEMWPDMPPCPFLPDNKKRDNVDLEMAKEIIVEWAIEAKKEGVIHANYWVSEYPNHWLFSPCGLNGEILYVSRGISVSKETGKTSSYFPPDHLEDKWKGRRIGNEPLHIDI